VSRPAQYSATVHDWARSEDAEHVECSANGVGRGDGYDVDIYRSRSTHRYLVRLWRVGSMVMSWWVADTLDNARAVPYPPRPRVTPPFTAISAPDRLREVRALTAQIRATLPARDDDAAER
jgi:hypothetical protein